MTADLHTLHTLCTPPAPLVRTGLGCAHTTPRPLKGVVCVQALNVTTENNAHRTPSAHPTLEHHQ